MFFNVSDVFSFSSFQRSACFPYVIPSAIFTRYFINDVVFFSSVGGLCFTEENSCSRVLNGLLQTFILCFFRVLDRGSVIEHEKDEQIAFLDMLISRRNNSISIHVYRKPTHTDRYLDYASHHDLKHKTSTVNTLINRSLNLPTTEDAN